MKKSLIFSGISLVALLLSGCNALPVPTGPTGPTSSQTTTEQPSTGESISITPTTDSSTSSTQTSSSAPTTSTSTSSSTSSSGSTTSTSTTPPGPQDYYASISDDLTGDALLNALRDLNKSKKKKEVGYSAMGTSAAGQFKYTDYDPDTVQYDSKGQPYGTTIISFYSGNKMTSFNREHVWPNTHGGSKVEDDIHMPRPTIPSENGSRGHSFYIEGMKTKNNTGWDPAMESFGKEDYRGDSARIIFYCMVANNTLTLVDDPSLSANTKNNQMGVISDMLSWNLRYPVLAREQRRNSGAEYLQGNRNPFIDHPEYACRIWSGFNSKTQQICSAKY